MKSQITYPPNDPRAASWPAAAKSSCPHCRQTLVMQAVEAGLRLQCFACRGELYVSRDLSQLVPLGQQPPASGAASPAPPKGWDLFICHASEQAAVAQGLVQELEQAGLSCWVAPRNIRKGSIYAEEIMLGLRQSQIVLVLHSPAADASPFVLREINEGVSLGKELLTVRIGDFQPCKSIAFYLSTAVQLPAEFAHGRLQAGPVIAHAHKQLTRSRELTRVIPTTQAAPLANTPPSFRLQTKLHSQLPPAKPPPYRSVMVLALLFVAVISAVALNWSFSGIGDEAENNPPHAVDPPEYPAPPPTVEIAQQANEQEQREQQLRLDAERKEREERERKEAERLALQRERDEKNKNSLPVKRAVPPPTLPYSASPNPPPQNPKPNPPPIDDPFSSQSPPASPLRPISPTGSANKADSLAYAESLGKTARVAGYDSLIRYLDLTATLASSLPPRGYVSAIPLGDRSLAFANPATVTLKLEQLIPFGLAIEVQKEPQQLKWLLHLTGTSAPPAAFAGFELRSGRLYFWWTAEFLAWRSLNPAKHESTVRWALYNHLLILGFEWNNSVAVQFFAPVNLRIDSSGSSASEQVLTFRETQSKTLVSAGIPQSGDESWFRLTKEHLEFSSETLHPVAPSNWPKDVAWQGKGDLPYLELKSGSTTAGSDERFEFQCLVNLATRSNASTYYSLLNVITKSMNYVPSRPTPPGKTTEERKKNEDSTGFKLNLKKWEERVKEWEFQKKELPRLQAIIDHASELKYPLRLVAKPKAGLNRTIVVAGFRPE